MDDSHLAEPPAGVSAALDTLRHALADPLSSAGLKLELLGRRLAKLPPDEALVEGIRSAKSDLAVAGRLVDLLPRLARIAAEAPSRASLAEICLAAGVVLDGDADVPSRLGIRRHAAVDALRTVSDLFRPPDPDGAPPRVRAAVAAGRVTLRFEALERGGPANPERFFQLPRDEERAGELFVALAAVESDGGALQLFQAEGRLVALLSWPGPLSEGEMVSK